MGVGVDVARGKGRRGETKRLNEVSVRGRWTGDTHSLITLCFSDVWLLQFVDRCFNMDFFFEQEGAFMSLNEYLFF